MNASTLRISWKVWLAAATFGWLSGHALPAVAKPSDPPPPNFIIIFCDNNQDPN